MISRRHVTQDLLTGAERFRTDNCLNGTDVHDVDHGRRRTGLCKLLDHHRKGWSRLQPGWVCIIERVAFDLLSTAELNQRKMLGPDQYLLDPIPRARCFIDRVDHAEA